MSSKKVTQLDQIETVEGEDLFYIVEDPGGTPTSRKVPSSFFGEPGNVLWFGADPTGATDSSAAFQAAVDSDYPVYVPPGKYLVNTTITISKPKLLYLGQRGIRTYLDGGNGYLDTLVAGEQVRLIKTANTDYFSIRCEQVYGYGGCFDTQAVTDYDKAVLHYPIVTNGNLTGGTGDYGGWAGGWDGMMYLGYLAAAHDDGANVIHLDTTNSEVNFAYLYFHEWKNIHVWGAKRALYAPARVSEYNQSLNNCFIDVQCNGVKQAIFNESVSRLSARVRHQARHVFTSQALADASPSIHSTMALCVWDCDFYDFAKAASGGAYTNEYSFDIDADDSSNRYDVVKGNINGAWVLDLTNCIPAEGSNYQSGIAVASSNNLADVDFFINSSGIKREGYCVFNADTNKPVYASGSASTDVWVDATGSTAHSPS